MTTLKQLTTFLDSYLQIDLFEDTCWNGLQIEGSQEVHKVGVAVDAGNETFLAAQEGEFDFLLVHHGHFWMQANPSLVGWSKERMDILTQNNTSLYAAHLPLDAHEVVGNNVQLLQLLGVKEKIPFHKHSGNFISYSGAIPQGMHINDIEKLLNEKLDTTCKTLAFGPSIVQSVAVCTGGGGYSGFFDALNEKVDLYITGDTAEVYQTAKDAGINVIFAGHYATETLGVNALGAVIGKEFNLEVEFIDIPTGL